MNQRPLYDPDERIFTLSDIKKLFLRQKASIFRAAWVGALVACCYFLIRTPPSYLITASFKESSNKRSSEFDPFPKLMDTFASGGSDSQTLSLIRSYQVLKPLVERMGVQAQIVKPGILSKVYRRIRDNLLAEAGFELSDVDGFSFRSVRYEGQRKIHYTLQFEDRDHFSILSGKKILASGLVGAPVAVPDAQLTIAKVPTQLNIKAPYELILQPWTFAVEAVRSKFQIRSIKGQKNIYDLSYQHRDRYFGAELLNALMEEYRNYLKRDHDQIAKDQLVYLEEKQDEICERMSKVFDDYTGYLQDNLSQSGHLGLKQEIEDITREYASLSNRILDLDLEWEQLSRMEANPRASLVSSTASPIAKNVHEILESISSLKEQRDLIELSFPSSKRPFNEEKYADRKEELKGIRDRIVAMHQLLDRVDAGETQTETLFHPETSLEAWLSCLNQSQGEEREDLAEYLENYIRLLSMQEKIVQEQIFYGSEIPSEFKGIDLATARSLFVDYNTQLDKSAAAMGHLSRLSEEIDLSDFEISSLCAVLSDPLSQRLIQQASDIAIKLKDESHRSLKEGSRWSDELKLQKKILKDHLEQLYKVEQLQFNMIQDKIAALKTMNLNCISGQISVHQERLSDCVKERKSTIASEKKILEEKMTQMRGQFSDLPDRWRKEKWLNLKSQMGVKMVQTLTDLVENKTISSHLHHIESKPLDHATLPVFPMSPNLMMKAFLGAFCAGLIYFSRSFLRAAFAGFPTSAAKLRAMRYPFLGEISSFCDGAVNEPLAGSDLDVLRQISGLIGNAPQGKIIGMIEGKGPDYSHVLAEHLFRMSWRTLVIRCDFHVKFSPEDQPGLLAVCQNDLSDLPLRKKNGYDYLPSGGYTRYGAELIRSQQFSKLLENFKKTYHCILLVFRSPLDSAESQLPLSLCDKAFVTVSGEPTEQLTPFLDWAYHEDECRLAFLCTS